MELHEQVYESVRDLFEAQVANFRVLNLLWSHERRVDEVAASTRQKIAAFKMDDEARERVARRIAQTIVQPAGPGEPVDEVEREHRWNAKAAELASLASQGLPERDFSGLTIRRNLSARSRESMLVTLWSDFEAFLAEVLRVLAQIEPRPLVPGTRQVTIEEVARHGSIDELIQHLASEWIDELFRESFDSWVKKFCESYGVEHPAVSDFLRESYYRRNLLVHAGATVNQLYLSRVGVLDVEQPKVGDRISVDREYLTRVADEIAAVAFTLAVTVTSKFDKQHVEEAESDFSNLCYLLLFEHRPGAVRLIGTRFRNGRFWSQNAKEVMKVNYWLACRDLGVLSECDAEIRDWDVSALQEVFQLAKQILQLDFEGALERARRMREQGRLQERLWTTWPLFRELRLLEREHESEK